MIVLDSSAIIPFLRIGRLSIFKDVFGTALIPEGVFDEIMKSPRRTESFAQACSQWIALKQLDTRQVQLFASKEELTLVDAEVLLLCLKEKAAMVSGDRALMQAAKAYGVHVFWSGEILLEAIKKEKMNKKQALEILDELIQAGFHIRIDVYAALRKEIEQP